MNRLSPLIVRRAGPMAAAIQIETKARAPVPAPDRLEDLKLFALGWVGGLVFFGTYLA